MQAIMMQENKDITELSGYKIPASAKYFLEYTGEDDLDALRDVCLFCRENEVPVLILSGGTNMLIAFDTYPGLIVHNTSVGYALEDKILEVASGHMIWDMALELEKEHAIDLWHRFIGLPGSVGGAVYGNAGCFGLETSNNFVSCTCLDMNSGELLQIKKEHMEFSYRYSCLKERRSLFCLSATFDLSEKREKYHSDVDNVYFREHKQPKGLSCGSFFKNPSREQTAGFLIEDVGLRGHKIGGAFFSEKHANFLMSNGTATSQDMLALVELAKKRVFEKHGLQLHNEVQIITETSGILLTKK